MNEDNKPVIETSVKDYNGKKINIIKIDIILTIILIVVAGFMIFTLVPKFANIHFIGNNKEYDEPEVTTEVKTDDIVSVEELNSEEYVVYRLTNKTGSTKDITLRLNTYVGDEVENTLSYELLAVNNGNTCYAYFKRKDLKIYDKYDYTVNSSNSIYNPATSYIRKEIGEFDKYKYIFTNYSGSILNDINIVILYYDNNNKIVNIESKNKTMLETNQAFEVNINQSYNNFDVSLNEAYYIKKES